MVDANTIGADKYFHCKANCEAAQKGSTAEFWSEKLSNLRESTDQIRKGDPRSASEEDQKANRYGREQGKNNTQDNCGDLCNPFRPGGLDEKY